MIVLGAAGLATWYLANHEKIEEEVWVGYRGEARYNPFLAAERLLTGVGVEAGSRESFRPSRWLPAASDTLVMRASAGVSTGDEFDSLTEWVTDYGGHLVQLTICSHFSAWSSSSPNLRWLPLPQNSPMTSTRKPRRTSTMH
jgi:hypothetical protein